MIIVSQDGNGDFKTIQEAIDYLPRTNTTYITILIRSGIYKEKINLTTPFITLKGEHPKTTVITFDDYALKLFPNGEKYGTFNSYTLFIGSHDITLENLTIENTSGFGSQVEQAVAVYADGDRLCFKNCHLLGHQDTLFTGPLPAKPVIPGSFTGPMANAPRINGRQYYEHCYIEGEVDFIFGSATAFFYDCELFSIDRGEMVNGYVTAASTPEGQTYGYVFEKCHLTSNCPNETVYLGRPWRDYAKTLFINCQIDGHIKKEGWHNWGKPLAEKVSFYGEYHNTGSGSDTKARVPFVHFLDENDAKHYTRQAVLSGIDNWHPW